MIRPTVEDLGFDIVQVLVMGGKKPRLQIMADRLDGTGINVDDCAVISRAVSALLDVEDPIHGAYALEVSSPGIDRPLVRLEDFETHAGFEAKMETRRLIDGRRKFRGTLKGVRDGNVVLDMDGAETLIDFADIQKGKLVMTDELLAASKERQNK